MRRTVLMAVSLAVVFGVGGLLPQEVSRAQPGDDNKAVCEIEEVCLQTVVCDEDIGEVDADGDLIALRDSTGATVKKATRKKAARKKATRKKATRKKATRKKAATFQFNEQRGDEIQDMPSDAQLASLLADLVGPGGFFDGAFGNPVCGDGVVEPPEVCEPPRFGTCGPAALCLTDCSACVPIPQ